MISKIQIKNFQSHRETTLDLHEGVNALIGLTGAGKSVVFKSLDWLFRNRPLGMEYRSWWVKPDDPTQVEIILKEGQRVGRVRTDSSNYYYIDKQKFEAFGKGSPPQPVLDLLNLSDVNFQLQSDPSFLISNSSGEVARYLNKAAHLDVIDQTLSSIASTLRKEKEDLGQTKKDLELTQEQLVLYDWLPEADEKLMGLEKLQERVAALVFQSSALVIVTEEYEKVEKELVVLQGILVFSKETDRLLNLCGQIEKQNIEWEQLAAIVDQYEKTEKELEGLIPFEGMGLEVKRLLALEEGIRDKRQKYHAFFDLVSDYGKIKKDLNFYEWLPNAEKEWMRLDKLKFDVLALRSSQTGLRQIVDGTNEVIEILSQTEKEREKLQKEFTRLMPDICPLCEQEIKK